MNALALSILMLPRFCAAAPELTAKEVVDKANSLLRGDSSHALVSMTVETPNWKRSLDLESWNLGRDRALIVVHAPAKDRGNATLKIAAEMWSWMPNVERVIKIPLSLMHNAWMGSDFDYEDIVKADSIFRDYEHRFLEKKPKGDGTVAVIEALPKEGAPVVWGKVLLTVELAADGSVTPTREDDYSERGELVRRIELSEMKVMGGRRVPSRLTCTPMKKAGRRTIVEYRSIEFDVPLKESFFSLKRLQARQGRS
jgi:hypothetical protein